jgi:hypothetical protein
VHGKLFAMTEKPIATRLLPGMPTKAQRNVHKAGIQKLMFLEEPGFPDHVGKWQMGDFCNKLRRMNESGRMPCWNLM